MTAEPISHLRRPTIPSFEGQNVDTSTVKISGLSALDNAEGLVVSTDDRVRLVGEFTVVGIRHYVDKNGDLVREQVLKPVKVETCPWNPADPTDDGVIRARQVAP
jgi:hypothetical protein